VLDEPGKQRVVAEGDTVCFNLANCHVDALEIVRVLQDGVERADVPRLRTLVELFRGDFLDGIEIDASPQFNHWVSGERRRFRAAQATLLKQLVNRLPAESQQILDYLEKWIQVAPLDRTAHELLLQSLIQRGRLREADEHLGATIRLFEIEGVDWLSIREAWRSAKQRNTSTKITATPIDVTEPTAPEAERQSTPRASVAVMPFFDRTSGELKRSGLGDGLADDIITRLAKLRVLTVIARGSAFAMSDRNIGAEEAARLIGVGYVATGTVRRQAGRIDVAAELIETGSSRVVWADQFECREDDAFATLDSIGNSVVASIAEEIETAERNRAILKAPTSLNSWEAYHRGLWHMYRFNNADNQRAAHFFDRAIELDPTFSRAYSALSFTHFQNAFLHRPAERQFEIDRAYETAGQSLTVDDRDPAAHLALGRALWLRGQEDESLHELQVSTELSPNFALGHYTLGFVHCQSGDPQIAIDAVTRSQVLSPFDPLLFAMLATHALSHLRLSQFDAATHWAIKAAARPNAHEHILSIAAHCLGAAGRDAEARAYIAAIRKRLPAYSTEDFLRAFRFSPDSVELYRRVAKRIGFD